MALALMFMPLTGIYLLYSSANISHLLVGVQEKSNMRAGLAICDIIAPLSNYTNCKKYLP